MKNYSNTTQSFFFSLISLLSIAPAYGANDRLINSYLDENICCGSPLICGGIGVQVKGGIVPILWTGRKDEANTACSVPTNFVAADRFKNFFKSPWTAGVEVDYAVSNNAKIYGDFQYRQAQGRSDCFVVPVFTPPINVSEVFRFEKYRSFSGYFGTDYHFDRLFCDRVSFFLGIKVGATHFKDQDLVITSQEFPENIQSNYFNRRTIFSGGGRAGFDCCLYDALSFVFTAEVLAQAGPRFGTINVPTPTVAYQVALNGVDNELLFPIQFGLRYVF